MCWPLGEASESLERGRHGTDGDLARLYKDGGLHYEGA